MNLRCVKIEDIKYPRNKITFQMKVMVLKNLMPSRFCALWNVCTLSKIRFECVSSLYWRINDDQYYMGHVMPIRWKIPKPIRRRLLGGIPVLIIAITFLISAVQIQRRICWEYFRNFRRLPTYDFAHAKVEKSIFDSKIQEFAGDIGVILNEFQSWCYSTIKISVKFIWEFNLEIIN